MLLKDVNIPLRNLITTSEEFDKSKFCDNNNTLLNNNSEYNLKEYIKKYHKGNANEKISFLKIYQYYWPHQLTKLYNNTINALKQSINNKEKVNNQVEIVMHFCEVI